MGSSHLKAKKTPSLPAYSTRVSCNVSDEFDNSDSLHWLIQAQNIRAFHTRSALRM